MRTPLEVLRDVKASIEENRGKDCIGIPFPWGDITAVTSGMRPGLLYVCGGYTSAGKSAFANEIAYHAMTLGNRVAIFSMEMSVETTMLRIAARHSGVPTLDILIGRYSEPEWEKIENAFRLMESTGFLVTDTLYRIKDMRKVIEAEAQQGAPFDLVIIDFIQNVMGQDALYARMANAAIDVQRMARDLKVATVVLSQVDNESVRNPSGVIGYKGAGEIAAAADVGFWLEKKVVKGEKDGGGEVRLEIRKHRHGRLWHTMLCFQDRFTRLASTLIPSTKELPESPYAQKGWTKDPDAQEA